jgi:hypothetical protein
MSALENLYSGPDAVAGDATPDPQASAPRSGEGGTVDDAAEIARLAKLSGIDYDRERDAAAKRLGCRVRTLDATVRAARGESAAPGQGRSLELLEPEPWPEPIAPEALYGLAGEVVHAIGRHSESDPRTLGFRAGPTVQTCSCGRTVGSVS